MGPWALPVGLHIFFRPLLTYPRGVCILPVSIEMPRFPKHHDLLPRLRRIEGQIRGISRMVEARRYCVDIIQQLTAVRKALDQVSLKIMSGHINTCVSDAIRRRDGEQKINELMQTINRCVK